MKGRKPNIAALPGALDKAPTGTNMAAKIRQGGMGTTTTKVASLAAFFSCN